MAIKTPFRYDYVGSFLRPEYLKQARAEFFDGKITREELTAVEDKAITELVKKQKELGYHAITDGEFRRGSWHLDFMWAFDGVSHSATDRGLPFHDEAAILDDTYLTGKVGMTGVHPFVEHFKFLKQFEDENTVVKQTIPAPAQFLAQFAMPFGWKDASEFYATREELAKDIAEGYKKVIKDLYDAGCRNLQIDDCTWGMLADRHGYKAYGVSWEDTKKVQEIHKDINNAVIAAVPADMVVNTHICRGNYHSTYANRGAYDPVADILLGEENVNAFYLEFDDERSGGFEPLAKVSREKKVVLGLITTKSPKLENKDTVIKRIHQAAEYIPLDRLYLSPQCGFASCEIGNKLTEEEQWAKLKLVKEIAKEVWG